jgi:pimeloyl-ACP methyl ester carboxylesterase
MPFADASGVPIHYDLAGGGPPLVLLPGWVGDSTTWRHAGYVDALADQFTLVLVDGRGRGRSGRPRDSAMYSADHLASDVLAVLDDLGVDRAGFWGQSLGGRVGLVFAIHHPDRLRAVVAGATRAQAVTLPPATIEVEVQSIREHGMAGVIADLETAGPLPEWLRSVILSADPAAIAACYAAMLDWPGGAGGTGAHPGANPCARWRPGPRSGRLACHCREDSRGPRGGSPRLRPPGDLHPQRPCPPDRAAVPD